MKNKPKKPVRVKPISYEPTKAELEEPIKLEVKGRTVNEKMDNLAKAMFRPVDSQ